MALGDGVRRNIAQVDPTERALLRKAILDLHHRYYPGSPSDTPPGGVSWWFKQDEIHQATHVHRGPEFVPWHREVVNRFEELIRQINPQLSLHYWDLKDDPRNVPNGNTGGGAVGTVNLFDSSFMGSSSGSAGDPLLAAGFYDPAAGTSGHLADRDVTLNPVDPPTDIARTRAALVPGSVAQPFTTGNQGTDGVVRGGVAQETYILQATSFAQLRVRLEDFHNSAHGYFANVSPHDAFRDPFVYFLHSGMDRIYARWQTDPAHPERVTSALTLYGSEANLDVTVNDFGESHVQNLTHLVEPWSTGVGEFHSIRPWEPTHENQGVPHTYHDPSVVSPPCYDTNLSAFRIDDAENPLNSATGRYQVLFNDVPEQETTWRSARIKVFTCDTTTYRVKPGTEPGAPFGIAIGTVTLPHGPTPHLYQDMRVWFSYTAGPLGSAPAVDGPVATTIICDETGEEFPFELRANSIPRPTVAVELVLDQSGSMADPAGTSGRTRLEVLKEAANLFVTALPDNSGLGLIRFDNDAYPPADLTYPGLPISRILSPADRNAAHGAVNAHGAHGSTSIGDGLILGRGQLTALPGGAYDATALLLLTDGLENTPQSIAAAIAGGFVDNRVFAIGLGNEFQVNTAALDSITGATGGNLLLSGTLTTGTDAYFRVSKFFLQILAKVTNTSIVRDPSGFIAPGTLVRIPFDLTEADISARVVLLTDYPVVRLRVEAPDGTIYSPNNGAAAGMTFAKTGQVELADFGLPLTVKAATAGGTWHALLDVDKRLLKRVVDGLREKAPSAFAQLVGRGARYCVSAHAFSNLRMHVKNRQDGHTPGSTLHLRAELVEYGIPLAGRATCAEEIELPDGSRVTVALSESQPGAFEGRFVMRIPGIYRLTTRAEGVTSNGLPFTREEIGSAATMTDGGITCVVGCNDAKDKVPQPASRT